MIRSHISIRKLGEEEFRFTSALLLEQLEHQTSELEKIGEDPIQCLGKFLHKNSADPTKQAEAESWAINCRIDLGRLEYFVATEGDCGRILGVSGLYSALPGYLRRTSAEVPESVLRLEDPDVFWMGWTAVIDQMKGKGLGTLLMRHGIGLARTISTLERIEEPQWAVLADSGAISFYEKKGMTRVIPHGSGWIFSDPLYAVEAKLDC